MKHVLMNYKEDWSKNIKVPEIQEKIRPTWLLKLHDDENVRSILIRELTLRLIADRPEVEKLPHDEQTEEIRAFVK